KLNGTGALTVTKSAAQAMIHCALDDFIGRRSEYEIAIQQILSAEASVISYFGSAAATEFSGTLDDSNLSFEETAGMLASAMFCEAHRFGSKLQINFEKPQENAVLLFNHRNKVPKSEKRSFSLGVKNAYDGIELEYTSPVDDARIKYIASDSVAPKNLKEIKSSGIRNDAQAKTRAWREWNKIKHQHISCQFDALDESEILRRNDKILVANQTRTDTQDGEVNAVDGQTL
ncbi:MAG: host specificity factor TipJ family phage tail protein, partial [Acinetobacter sp.]